MLAFCNALKAMFRNDNIPKPKLFRSWHIDDMIWLISVLKSTQMFRSHKQTSSALWVRVQFFFVPFRFYSSEFSLHCFYTVSRVHRYLLPRQFEFVDVLDEVRGEGVCGLTCWSQPPVSSQCVAYLLTLMPQK